MRGDKDSILGPPAARIRHSLNQASYRQGKRHILIPPKVSVRAEKLLQTLRQQNKSGGTHCVREVQVLEWYFIPET